MATRKETYTPDIINDDELQAAAEPEQTMPDFTVRIYPIQNPRNKLVANASITLGGVFAVRGFRIFKQEDGFSIGMPQHNYIQRGTELTADTFFPVTKEAREKLTEQIVDSYLFVMEREASRMNRITEQETDVQMAQDDDLPFEYDEPYPEPVMGM